MMKRGFQHSRVPGSCAANIDQTPVHNLAAEPACGKIDYRIKRTHSLPPVSRQMILQRYFHHCLHHHVHHLPRHHCDHNHRCKELRNGTTPTFSFRGYKAAADKKREFELFWTRSMNERMRSGSERRWTLTCLTWMRTTRRRSRR